MALSSGQSTSAARRLQSLWILLPTRCGPLGYFIRAPGELMKGQHSHCFPNDFWFTRTLFTCKRRQELARLRNRRHYHPQRFSGGLKVKEMVCLLQVYRSFPECSLRILLQPMCKWMRHMGSISPATYDSKIKDSFRFEQTQYIWKPVNPTYCLHSLGTFEL